MTSPNPIGDTELIVVAARLGGSKTGDMDVKVIGIVFTIVQSVDGATAATPGVARDTIPAVSGILYEPIVFRVPGD